MVIFDLNAIFIPCMKTREGILDYCPLHTETWAIFDAEGGSSR